MRTLLAISTILLVGCHSSRQPSTGDVPTTSKTHCAVQINPESYSHPFGHAPREADLGAILLSLPDELAADMPVKMREEYIREYGTKSFGFLFDTKHQFATYYSGNPYNPIRPSSRFYFKILPSNRYPYIVAIHFLKPSTSGLQNSPSPSAGNTFFLAPINFQWADITDQILPKAVHRDWYFQPEREKQLIETGPYEEASYGGWREGERVYDLIWKRDHFAVRYSPLKKFSDDF